MTSKEKSDFPMKSIPSNDPPPYPGNQFTNSNPFAYIGPAGMEQSTSASGAPQFVPDVPESAASKKSRVDKIKEKYRPVCPENGETLRSISVIGTQPRASGSQDARLGEGIDILHNLDAVFVNQGVNQFEQNTGDFGINKYTVTSFNNVVLFKAEERMLSLLFGLFIY